MRVPGLAARVPPLHRHAVANKAVALPVVLDKRAGEVDASDLLDRLFAGGFRKIRIQALQRRPQVTNQHDLALGGSPQRSMRPEGLRVVGVDAVPAKDLLQMVGEGLLDQPVFAVDVGEGHGLFRSVDWLRFGSFAIQKLKKGRLKTNGCAGRRSLFGSF